MKVWTNTLIAAILALATFAVPAVAQSKTGTTTLNVTVGPESSLVVNTGTTNLTKADSVFGDYISTVPTSLTYKIRTASSGTITASIAEFAGNGPKVADLSFTGTSDAPGTGVAAATGSIVPATAKNVVTFGANAHSAKTGNAASVDWRLVDDPMFEIGSYTTTVTFTISNT